MSVEAAKSWLGVGASSVVFAAIGWIAHWYWNRIRWTRFETSMRSWAHDVFSDDLSELEWKSLTALKLFEAGFSPTEVQALLELAVLVARGKTSMEIRGRVQIPDRESGA